MKLGFRCLKCKRAGTMQDYRIRKKLALEHKIKLLQKDLELLDNKIALEHTHLKKMSYLAEKEYSLMNK